MNIDDSDINDGVARKSRAVWPFVQQMLSDITDVVLADAASESEVLEGLRVIARIA